MHEKQLKLELTKPTLFQPTLFWVIRCARALPFLKMHAVSRRGSPEFSSSLELPKSVALKPLHAFSQSSACLGCTVLLVKTSLDFPAPFSPWPQNVHAIGLEEANRSTRRPLFLLPKPSLTASQRLDLLFRTFLFPSSISEPNRSAGIGDRLHSPGWQSQCRKPITHTEQKQNCFFALFNL